MIPLERINEVCKGQLYYYFKNSNTYFFVKIIKEKELTFVLPSASKINELCFLENSSKFKENFDKCHAKTHVMYFL